MDADNDDDADWVQMLMLLFTVTCSSSSFSSSLSLSFLSSQSSSQRTRNSNLPPLYPHKLPLLIPERVRTDASNPAGKQVNETVQRSRGLTETNEMEGRDERIAKGRESRIE